MTQLASPVPLQFLTQLLRQSQSGQLEARRANEARRDDILKGRTDTRNRVLGAWDTYGDSLVSDTNDEFAKRYKNGIAHLSQLGMLGSTNVESLNTQNATAKLADLRRVKDDITSNRTGADERLSNNIDDFKERIVDSYPQQDNSASLINSLISMLGNGGLGGNSGPQSPADIYRSAYPQPWQMQQPIASAPPRTPRPPTAPDNSEQAMRSRIQQINSQTAEDYAPMMEQLRRDAMTGLSQAMVASGVDGEQQRRDALWYLQHRGWATPDPLAYSRVTLLRGGGSGAPSYYPQNAGEQSGDGSSQSGPPHRTPLWQRDPVFASILSKQGLHPWTKAGMQPPPNGSAAPANVFTDLLSGLRSLIGA